MLIQRQNNGTTQNKFKYLQRESQIIEAGLNTRYKFK